MKKLTIKEQVETKDTGRFTDIQSAGLSTMNKDKVISELKKYLVYNRYRDTYVIRGENLPFMAEELVKLFAIPDVVKSVCVKCKTKPAYEKNAWCITCLVAQGY